MKRYFSIILCCLFFLQHQAQQIVFTPQWLPQAQFVGYYVAQEKGFYKDEGLDVVIKHPSPSYSALNRMIDGNSHIVTMKLPQAIVAIDRGFPLVNLLQTSQHNSLLIVPRKDSIQVLDDLRNKRVGIWKVDFNETAQLLDRQYGLNFEWIQFLQGINLLVAGAIDATFAMSYNEYWLILASGIYPKHVFAVADYGLDIPEDGLYVTQKFYKAFPEKAKAFARASKRGWEWTVDNPEEALEIVMEVMKRERVSTNIHHQRWMLREVLLLNCDEKVELKKGNPRLKTEVLNVKGKASFQLKPEQLKHVNELLIKEGMIRKGVDYHQFWKGEAQ